MGLVTLEEFAKIWESQIEKIEKQALDGDAVSLIRLHFDRDKLKFQMFVDKNYAEENDVYLRLDLLESKLNFALEAAHSRFRLENRGILAKAFSGVLDKFSRK